ncbi:hypothetical protein COO60DRAFT_1546189 [Scenedesmus sp. NREL 46B-D3]|nr:hypothetical protein COO60DRAFT_1546189 [Scenedesmus sp. NREL 46B-D3]
MPRKQHTASVLLIGFMLGIHIQRCVLSIAEPALMRVLHATAATVIKLSAVAVCVNFGLNICICVRCRPCSTAEAAASAACSTSHALYTLPVALTQRARDGACSPSCY